MWQWGVTVQGQPPVPLIRQGQKLQPEGSEIQGAGEDLQLLLHREWLGVRARGHPVLAGTAVSVAGPGGTGREALSLPGTLIKPRGDARRRHPSLHTQITSYMCFIYCAVFN